MGAPDLSDIFQAWLGTAQADIHVSMPGIIKTYDSARQRASVQPAVKRGFVSEDGIRDVETLPVVHEVPVKFQGSGGHSITFPVSPGDECLLIISSVSLEAWLRRGGVVDPEDDRHHHLTDAVCLPGLRHGPLPGAAVGAGMVLRSASVLLGDASAFDPVLRRSDLQAFMAALAAAIAAVPGGATGPAELSALQTALNAALWPASTGSPVVKAV